jgi:hypothetical protein
VKSITAQSEFESAINAEKAIIFITYEWSGQAIQSEQVVAKWVSEWRLWHKDLLVPIFKIEPDEYSFMLEWLRENVNEHGYGSLVWIKDGAIVDYERFVATAGIEDVARRTETIFRN